MLLGKMPGPAERNFYLKAVAAFGWSRNVLLNQIKARAYDRSLAEGKSHNFPLALPDHLAEQSKEALKSSYNLEFLGIRQAVKERELENQLIDKLRDFILEFGYGFCFIGQVLRGCADPGRDGCLVISDRDAQSWFGLCWAKCVPSSFPCPGDPPRSRHAGDLSCT